MGTITINVEDNVEADFRKMVESEYGTGKGILGKAVAEALKKWIEEKEQKEIKEKLIKLMDSGFKSGIKMYKERGELYERRCSHN
ncbi:hypothetical protein J4468_03920 [Candidatus Woesearchaeota archaeon]|nr:hypothetical protein [Candidatus Woesearchaeota archaeon]